MRITASTTGRAGRFSQIPLVNEVLMREVGDLALSLIRRRTTAGKDVDEAPFTPLSADYATQKAKALGHSDADLTVSGRMLNEMGRLAVTAKTVTVGFRGGGTGSSRASGGTFIQRSRSVAGADKAYFHQVSGAGASRVKRRFFGLSDDEKQQIVAAVDRHMRRQAKGGLG